MSKKRNGGKKSPKSGRPSVRPSAPSSRAEDHGGSLEGSLEEAIAASHRGGVSAAGQGEGPEPPDTLAPTTSDPYLPAQLDAAIRATLPSTPPSEKGAGQRSGKTSAAAVAVTSASRLPVADHDDDHEFFAGEKAAVAQFHAEAHRSFAVEEEEVKASIRITPEIVARQKKLRRVVSWVVGVAAVMSVAVGVRVATFTKVDTDISAAIAAPAARPETKPVEEAKPVHDIAATPVHDEPAKPADEVKAAHDRGEAAKPVEPAKPVEEAKPAEAATDEPKPATLDPEKAKALTKKALQQLEMGKYAAAIESASASVEADPTDANAYLYWGTALMEQGKRADAKKIFGVCAEKATRGQKHECRQFK